MSNCSVPSCSCDGCQNPNSAAYDRDDHTGTVVTGHAVPCECAPCKAQAHLCDDVWFIDAGGKWRKIKSPWVKGKIPAWLAVKTDPTPFTSLRPIGVRGKRKARFWAHVHALNDGRTPDANTCYVVRFLGGLTHNGEMARGIAFAEGFPALLKLSSEFGMSTPAASFAPELSA